MAEPVSRASRVPITAPVPIATPVSLQAASIGTLAFVPSKPNKAALFRLNPPSQAAVFTLATLADAQLSNVGDASFSSHSAASAVSSQANSRSSVDAMSVDSDSQANSAPSVDSFNQSIDSSIQQYETEQSIDPSERGDAQLRQSRKGETHRSISDADRERVVMMRHDRGFDVLTISDMLDIKPSTVRTILRQFNRRGTWLKLKKGGNRRPTIGQQAIKAIIESQKENSLKSLKDIRNHLASNRESLQIESTPCLSSIRKILCEHGFTTKSVSFVPIQRNTEEAIKARYEYANWASSKP